MKSLTRCEEIVNFREKTRECKGILAGQYPHVVEDKIYYQMETPKEVHYAQRSGEGYRKPLYNNIIKKSLSAHNFSVFYDSNPNTPDDERYKAVGGYHVGRASVKTPWTLGLHQASLYGELNDCEISSDLDVVEFKDPVWSEFTKLLFHDDFYHPRHANGLYIFKSHNGIEWTEYHDKPIFSTLTECESPYEECLAFDTHPSIFYDRNQDDYIIYMRGNLKLGVRHVMYSRSKDLVNWSKPKLIKTDPSFDFDRGNLYFMCAKPYASKYLAFPPHFKNEIISDSNRRYYDTKTQIMISDNGEKWRTVGSLFEGQTNGHMDFPHVASFRVEDDKVALYVHEGFMSTQGKLVRYTIDKEEVDALFR